MSSKTEQINLRITSELKTQLSEVAASQGMSMSDYIRQTLEDSINQDSVQDRITSLEDKLKSDREKEGKMLLYAAATIGSIDTGLPLDQCLQTSMNIAMQRHIDFQRLWEKNRDEFEIQYLKVQDQIKSELGLSDRAVAFISVMFTSILGLNYGGPIFDMSPFAVKTLERIRHQLNEE